MNQPQVLIVGAGPTGLVLALVIALPCTLLLGAPGSCGSWLFLAGLGLAGLSVPLARGEQPPTGLLAYLQKRQVPTPATTPTWWDRIISPRNVWLVAALTMIALSFLPPFLG